MRAGRLFVLLVIISFLVFPILLAAQAVNNGNQTGLPPFGSFHGDNFDLVSMQNGNLHVEIPFANVPRRGGTLAYRFIYDTPTWELNTFRPTPTSQPIGMVSLSSDSTGWRVPNLVNWGVTNSIQQRNCTYVSNPGAPPDQWVYLVAQLQVRTLWTVIDPTGAKHPIPLYYAPPPPGDCQEGVPQNQLTSFTLDGTGIFVDLTSNINSPKIILKDGTQVSGPWRDTNGNQPLFSISTSGTSAVSVNRTSDTYTVTDSNGNSQQYRVDIVPVPVHTSFCGLVPPTAMPGGCTEYSGTWYLPSAFNLPSGKSYQFTWAQNGHGDLLRVDLPTGGSISYTYAGQSYAVAGTRGTKWYVRRGVTSRTVNDGTTSNAWTYAIGGSGGGTITDPLGNQEVHVFDFVSVPAGSSLSSYEKEVRFYQGSSSTGTLLRTEDKDYAGEAGPIDQDGYDYGLINVRVIRETTKLDNGQQSKIETDFDTSSFTGPAANYTYTRLNATERREFDYGVGAPGPLLRRTDNTYLHTANTTYQNLNIADRTTSTIVYDGVGAIRSQTQFEYDNYTQTIQATDAVQHDSGFNSGYLTRGNITATLRWRNTDGGWLTTRNQYDDVGNIISTTDPLNHTTTFDFADAFGNATCAPGTGSLRMYVKRTTNALGQITSSTHNSCTSTVASNTDPNNQTTTLSYDLLNRVVAINLPDGGQTTNCYTDMGGATCTQAPAPFSIVTTKKINPTTSLTTVSVTDALARSKQTQLASDPQGTVYTDTTYDALGRVATVSNPHRSGTDITTTLGTTAYGYDALSRKTSETYPDGSILTTAYCGPTTLVTDPTGRWRRSTTDALGRLVEVDEPNAPGATVASTGCPGTGEPIWVTSYTNDALGNLTQVVQNGSHQRNFAYDSLSRLLTSNNPEVGTITYKYDLDANCASPNSFPTLLASKTDARGIRTCAQYDALNRITQKSYSDGITPTANFGYDQQAPWGWNITNYVGRLTSESNGQAQAMFNYDPMGRVINYGQCTPLNCTGPLAAFHVLYTYDLAGNTTQITYYPSGRVVNYTYDSANRPSTATDGSNGVTYATGFQTSPGGSCTANVTCYTPQGTFYALSIGQSSSFTGLNLTHSYNSRLQPQEFKASSSGGNAIDISYSFVDPSTSKNSGHVFSITNNLDSTRSQTFGYDQLNRITAAQTTSTYASSPGHCWGETYGVDPWGNLQSIVATTNSDYTGCSQESGFSKTADGNNHLSGFSYDVSGNTTNDGVNSYTWDAESQLSASAGVTYTYDVRGRRVSKSTGKNYVYGMGDEIFAEIDASGNTTAEYIFFGGKRIAMLPAGGNPIYYVEDLLGTSRVTTTNAGVVCYDADFYPYGGERPYTNTCPQNYKFEGKERDTETGNDEFGARYYSNRFGRWLSADWSAVPVPVPYANLTNPQTLNLYAMVADDPESFADLDGHCIEDACALEVAAIGTLVRWAVAALATVGAAAVHEAVSNSKANGAPSISGPQPQTPLQATWQLAKDLKAKSPPNPDGSNGKPDHQAGVEQANKDNQKEAQEGETVESNKQIKGHDSTRRPDSQIVDKNGRTRKITEVERKPGSNRNKQREAEYNKLGIPNETRPVPPTPPPPVPKPST